MFIVREELGRINMKQVLLDILKSTYLRKEYVRAAASDYANSSLEREKL
jgi:hypothetical protein